MGLNGWIVGGDVQAVFPDAAFEGFGASILQGTGGDVVEVGTVERVLIPPCPV